MIDKLVELVVASIIVVIGVGVALVLEGANPEIAENLISSATELGVYILVIGVLVAIPLSLIR